MTQKPTMEKKIPFVARMVPRIKQELEWLADWHGSSMSQVFQQAIHQMALRDLPGLQDTGIVQLRHVQEREREEAQEQEREEQLV